MPGCWECFTMWGVSSSFGRQNTFNDADSIDHALFGAELLFGEEQLIRGYLDFEKEAPKEEELALMRTAVASHSAYRLPKDRE